MTKEDEYRRRLKRSTESMKNIISILNKTTSGNVTHHVNNMKCLLDASIKLNEMTLNENDNE